MHGVLKASKSIRKTWAMNPVQRVHSTKKGKKAYSRSESKRIARESY